MTKAGLSHSTADHLLEKSDTRISIRDSWQIIEAVRQLTNDDTIGFTLGLSMPLTSHGPLAYAAMCASTPRQAVNILEKFWHLRQRGVSFHRKEAEADICFELTPDLPLPQAFRDVMFSSTLTAVLRAMEFVMPTSNRKEIRLQGPEPAGFHNVAASLPSVHFKQPRAALCISNDPPWMDRPLPTANAEAFEIAVAQCEREAALYQDHRIVRQVRSALVASPEGYPSMEALAEQLNLSPRTLRRHLNQEGQSYQQLLEEARSRDCEELLATSDMSLQKISEMLGYSEPANFTRAFRRWKGISPSQWRRTRL